MQLIIFYFSYAQIKKLYTTTRQLTGQPIVRVAC
uniref:Uncharacterized protein n=1 Tax=Setaria viridis TaxID=4556 RepID=A0A4U6UJ99_SETVI|nr:hypothetical protein SEVIR_5G209450v2 [Setaria viridis]